MSGNYKIIGNCTAYLGEHGNKQQAIDRLNIFFAKGYFEASFLENSPVILENSAKKYPLKIMGIGKNRTARLL